MAVFKTTETYIKECKLKHGSTYSYKYADYKSSRHPVVVICKRHGKFEIEARVHLRGQGCPRCSSHRLWTQQTFIAECKRLSAGKDSYTKTVFTGVENEITITCNTHGDYQQLAKVHLRGSRCPACTSCEKGNLKSFIAKSRQVHGLKFSYENTVYTNAKSKVTITCPIHGDFQQLVNNHLAGRGCPHCGVTNRIGRSWHVVELDGEEVKLQGYEPKALTMLLQEYPDSKILVGSSVPRIKYKDGEKRRTYYPDFFLPELNLIVEVKSEWTWKLGASTNVRKLNAARKKYVVRLIVFDNKGCLVRDITKNPLCERCHVKRHRHLR